MAVVEQNYVTFEEIAAAEKDEGIGSGQDTRQDRRMAEINILKKERRKEGGGVDEHYRVCVFLALICVFVHS